MTTYEPIIGLEIHVELKTKSKMFCGCKNDPFFAKHPNIYTCPVCLGLPGALPVPNKKAVEWTMMLGLALGCEIPPLSKFDRKHYFYPDLPKGYQISQYDQPLCSNGKVSIEDRFIRIRRVHLEEDTAKLLHTSIEGKKVTLIDFNRSGVPLVEIVTEPDIRSGKEARFFLKKLHQIIRYLDISDADMEKGSMRLEPNISVRAIIVSGKSVRSGKSRSDPDLPGYKVEVKNINSFRFVERAINYEIERQTMILERGEVPVQETRGWNEGQGVTLSQRTKEEAADYRYFPEPDIPPIRWEKSQISSLKSQIPEQPDAKRERFMKTYGLNDYDANLLTETRELADYFEEAANAAQAVKESSITAKHIANWLINKKVDLNHTLPAELIGQIGHAKRVVSMDEGALEKVVAEVVARNAKAVNDYKKGKQQSLMFLVGQIMRVTKGQANAQEIKKMLQSKLQ